MGDGMATAFRIASSIEGVNVKRSVWFLGVITIVLALGAIGLTGCGNKAAGSTSNSTSSSSTSGLSGPLNVEGSDTMVNLANSWAEQFMTANQNVNISVKGGGSGNGIAALINGTTDFADASREMKPEEITQAKVKGVNPVETAVARDGITFIVNPANPVNGLTTDQLGKIYRGEITNWKDVGGPDQAIVLLSRDSSSGTYEFVKTAIVGSDKNYSKAAKLLPSTQAIVDETKGNPAAIGYIGIGYETPDVKALTVNGIASTVATVLDNSYPISRDLYIYTNGDPTGVGKTYMEWILGTEGQKVVQDEGFVPIGQ